MMPMVPGGPAVGISGVGSQGGGIGSSGASISSLPGAKAPGRGLDAGGAGSGDGFGSVMQAAMGGGSAQAAGRMKNPAGRDSATAPAKQDLAQAKPGQGVAGGQTAGAGDVGQAAGAKQAALADAEKKLAVQTAAAGDGSEAGSAAWKAGGKPADGATGTGLAGTVGDGSAGVAAGKDAAGGAAQAEVAKLQAGATGNVSSILTKDGLGAANAAADPSTQANGAIGGKSAGTTNVEAGLKTDSKSDPKTGQKKHAGAQDAAAPLTGQTMQIAQPGWMNPATVAAAAANGGAAQAAAAQHGAMGGDRGSVAGKVRSGVAPAPAIVAAGHAAGKSAALLAAAGTTAAQMVPSAMTSVAGGAAGASGASGVGGSDAANIAVGVIAGPVAAGAGSGGQAGMGHAGGGQAGAGHDASALLAPAGMRVANPQKQGAAAKDGSAGVSSGPAAIGFTASLLQGHPGAGMPGAAHNGVQHAAGGLSGANPYARMDETQGHTLVSASPQKMSVAVSDPSLGSFQVRAQGAGTQIAASLATASAATHAQLSGHLPSLTAFLQDQRVDLARVTVVQQSLLGGDAGPRDFGGHERQGRSGARGGRPKAGAVRAVGSAGSPGSAGSVGSAGSAGSAAGATEVAGATEDAMAMAPGDGGPVTPALSLGSRTAGASMASVDLLA